ncbi:MAG: phage holin family protein [Actinomycetes bacterium]
MPPDGTIDDRSTAEVLRSVTTNAQTLVRKEVELAKLELQEGLSQQVKAIVLLLVAAVLGLFVLAFAGVTAAKALEQTLAAWVAWLIVTGAFTLIAVVAVFVAKGILGRSSLSPEQTTTSIQENVAWAKQRLGR